MTRLLTERLLEAADRVPPLAAHDLRALLEVAAETIIRLDEELVAVGDAYEELAAECEKLRKDAERYRWLRDNCEMTADEYGTAGQLYFGTYQSGRLDEAIAAAMQGDQP